MTWMVPTCWRRLVGVLVFGGLAFCPARSADAASAGRPSLTVERLAEQAKKALEQGDHERAASLYLGAFKQDATQTVLVFNAARALHLGRRIDRAEETYRLYLGLPAIDARLADSARAYLAEIRLSRADERALEAQQLGQLGRFGEAAAAWRDAFRIAPGRVFYLLRAARAQRLSREPALARADYVTYLAHSRDDRERAEAQRELTMLDESVAAQRPDAPAATLPTPATAVAMAAAPTRVVAGPDPMPYFDTHALYWLEAAMEWTTRSERTTAGGRATVLRAAWGWQYSPQIAVVVVAGGGFQQSFAGAVLLQSGVSARVSTTAGHFSLGAELVSAHVELRYPCSLANVQAAEATCRQDWSSQALRARAAWQWRISPSTAVAVAMVADRQMAEAQAISAAESDWLVGATLGLAVGRP